MARYIDADALLRDIYRNPEGDSGERCAQILEAILSAPTADVAPREEWISVDERLPDCEQGAESEAVLFITKQGFMYTGYFGCGGIYHDRYFREYKNSTEGYDISNVTHWMPLPEPPQTEGGAK